MALIPPPAFTALSVPVHRASTLVFNSTAEFLARKSNLYDGFSYGLYGTPTTRALEARIASIEGGKRAVLVPSGLAALTHPMLAFLSAGDHVLMADCVYGPARDFCNQVLHRMGISTTYFAADADSISDVLQANTRLIILESPGSFTMEIQNIERICEEAHAANALVLIDNTWGFGSSNMFSHGVDIVCTALSKYASGHSDVCMGSITARNEDLYRQIKAFVAGMGTGVSSDDTFLVMRGLSSLQVRLDEHARRALAITDWLRRRPEVLTVMNPAHPDDTQHARFEQYFTGGNGLVSLVLRNQQLANISAMMDGMRYFRIGASWGGTDSLIAVANVSSARTVLPASGAGYILRLHIGLEPLDLLYDDLEKGFARLNS